MQAMGSRFSRVGPEYFFGPGCLVCCISPLFEWLSAVVALLRSFGIDHVPLLLPLWRRLGSDLVGKTGRADQ